MYLYIQLKYIPIKLINSIKIIVGPNLIISNNTVMSTTAKKRRKKDVYTQTNFPLLNLPSLNIEPSAFVSTK